MASIYRPTYTRDIPPDLVWIERKGRTYARFRDGRGRVRTVPAKLTKNKDKLLIESDRYVIEYHDADGKPHRVRGYTDEKATRQRAAELERRVAHEQTGLVDKYADLPCHAASASLGEIEFRQPRHSFPPPDLHPGQRAPA